MSTIYLPPRPAIHVREVADPAIPAGVLKELVELSRAALAEPWKIEEGEHKGEDWPVASFGQDYQLKDDGKVDEEKEMVNIGLTTDCVRASERRSSARDEAEWCLRARKIIFALSELLVDDDKTAAQETVIPGGGSRTWRIELSES